MKINSLVCLILIISFSSCSTVEKYKDKLSKNLVSTKPSKKNFKLNWIKNNDPEYESGNLPVSLNSPKANEDFLYAGHNDGYMISYDIENGRIKWKKKDLGSYNSKPTVYKDQIIYGTDHGRLYSRNYLTGELKYSVVQEASFETEGTVYKGMIFFHLRNHKILSMDVETGKILWAYKRSIPFLTTIQRASRPLVVNNKLYVGFPDGVVCAFSIEDGVLLWERKIASGNKFIDLDMMPVIYKGKLLVGSIAGPLTVLSKETGNIIRKLNFVVNRAPYVLSDGLLFGTVDGELIMLDRNFDIVKRQKISDRAIGNIKAWKGHFVIPTASKEIFLVDVANLNVVETFSLGHSNSSILGDIEVHEGKLSFMSSRNRLYVFK